MTGATQKTVGEVLIDLLESRGIDTVFGIPGVHTVELYRGLATSNIRHITPRHELSAGFMADGYARVSGKPGVCFLITGPGLTNAITAMAQARADSIPMLVISGVNRLATHGKEQGHLHELPDQAGLMRTVAISSETVVRGEDLDAVMERAFTALGAARPGPVHVEIPLDVMVQRVDVPALRVAKFEHKRPSSQSALRDAARRCDAAARPVIILGGGSLAAEDQVRLLAERLDAPVVTTVNARGMLAGHRLEVPASPSLGAVRKLLADSDLVLAIGTQFGPTDFDMYVDGGFPELQQLLRIDIDPAQIARGPKASVGIVADAACGLAEIYEHLDGTQKQAEGLVRAKQTRDAAFAELSPRYCEYVAIIDLIGDSLPDSIIVGDSTQLVYAGNLFTRINRKNGWFNSATGYGSLGYGAPAAIGAKLGAPDAPVVCITGDGGFQFCLAELGTAMDEETPVIFLVWNNGGYQEIESYMIDQRISPTGVRPSPPDFVAVAKAYGMAGERLSGTGELAKALARAQASGQSYLIEILTD